MLAVRRQFRLFRMLQMSAMALVASAAVAQGLTGSRYLISEADIVKQLSVLGVSVDVSQVHLPLHMSAAVVSPKLEIVTAQSMGGDQVRVECRCGEASDCLPFLATVVVRDSDLVAAEIRSRIGLATGGQQTLLRNGLSAGTRVRLGVGSRAVLIIRDGHLDIRLQVLAIDSGTIGQQIRVCTLDRKKVFHAIITGEGTLAGVLE